jgi:purine-cytosine permease-like protein
MFLQCYFYMSEYPLLIICCLLIPCLFYGSIFGCLLVSHVEKISICCLLIPCLCLLVSHAEKTSICAQVTSCKSKA